MGKDKKESKDAGNKLVELNPRPEFIDARLAIWDELMAKHKAELALKVRSTL